MKLKSYKTIQMIYVIVSVSALMTACHNKVTEPLKLMSKTETQFKAVDYGVPEAQTVLFSQTADWQTLDLSYQGTD